MTAYESPGITGEDSPQRHPLYEADEETVVKVLKHHADIALEALQGVASLKPDINVQADMERIQAEHVARLEDWRRQTGRY